MSALWLSTLWVRARANFPPLRSNSNSEISSKISITTSSSGSGIGSKAKEYIFFSLYLSAKIALGKFVAMGKRMGSTWVTKTFKTFIAPATFSTTAAMFLVGIKKGNRYTSSIAISSSRSPIYNACTHPESEFIGRFSFDCMVLANVIPASISHHFSFPTLCVSLSTFLPYTSNAFRPLRCTVDTGIRQPFNCSIIVSVQSTAIRSHSRFIQYATSDWTRFSFWCCRVHFFPAPFENFIYAQSSSACTKNLHVRVNKITSVLFICWHVCGVWCITYREREFNML